MNKFICIGRLTKDPHLSTTSGGVSMAKFSVAVDRKYRNEAGERETDFFNITAWRGLAENIAKYQQKGSKVCVVGELQNSSWEAEDGTKRYSTEIVASECEFLDSKKDYEHQVAEGDGERQDLSSPVDDGDLPF